MLGASPMPKKVDVADLASCSGKKGRVVIDTLERITLWFMGTHLKGLLLSSLNKSFYTVAGC